MNEIEDSDKRLIDKAILHNSKEEFSSALEILNLFSQKYSENSIIMPLLGSVHYNLGNLNEGIKYFKISTNLDPGSELASIGLFVALWDDERFEEALDEFNRFLINYTPEDYLVTIKELKDSLETDSFGKYDKIIIEHYNKYLTK